VDFHIVLATRRGSLIAQSSWYDSGEGVGIAMAMSEVFAPLYRQAERARARLSQKLPCEVSLWSPGRTSNRSQTFQDHR
jgi:hypothetical protein